MNRKETYIRNVTKRTINGCCTAENQSESSNFVCLGKMRFKYDYNEKIPLVFLLLIRDTINDYMLEIYIFDGQF